MYKNLKIIVTGSTGFKGSWLCFWLNKQGAKVIGVGLKPEKDSIIFKSLNLNKLIKQYYFNICDFKKLNNVILREKPDMIFHLAAQSVVSLSYSQPLLTLKTNVLGSINVLEVCRLNKIKNLIYITSDKCYYNRETSRGYKESDILGGKDNYSSSKACAELIFKSYYESFFKNNSFLTTVTARAGNVIGGGDFKKDRIVPDAIKSFKNKRNLYLRSPLSTRPWQHVLEPLSGYIQLGEFIIQKKIKNKFLPSWNFGPEKKNCKTVIQIVEKLAAEWPIKPKIVNLSKYKKFKEANLLSLNIKKAEKELNWKPKLSLDQTIKFTVQWYKKYFLGYKMTNVTVEQIEQFEDI